MRIRAQAQAIMNVGNVFASDIDEQVVVKWLPNGSDTAARLGTRFQDRDPRARILKDAARRQTGNAGTDDDDV